MFIKPHIEKSIRGSIPDCAKLKKYFKALEEQFETSDKALASTLMTKMCSMKFNVTKEVHEHIMEMRDIAAQLRLLDIEMSESFLFHFILNSLLSEYGSFKISYNSHKKMWSVNELLAMLFKRKEE